ncbi:MAG: molybdopterin dinucleotide binding domain-containing protein, partial [Acidimicrobiales bacterium]
PHAPGPARPRPLIFEPGAVAPAVAPAKGAYRLVVRRTLYDRGTLVAESPSLAPLVPEPAVFVSPAVLRRLGVKPGAMVTVRSARDSLVMPVRVDGSLPRGAVFVVANLAGPGAHGASALVDGSLPATDVWLEKA